MKLLITGGQVITIAPDIGNGPFNVLIEDDLDFAHLKALNPCKR